MNHCYSRGRSVRAFAAALAAGAAIVSAYGASYARALTGPLQEAFRFPDSPAGRAAAAYVQAFNSRDDGHMMTFILDYRPEAYLDEHPMEELVEQHHKLYDTFGALTPLRAALALDLQVTLLAQGSKAKGALIFRFQVEEAPPHKLSFLTTSGVDNAQLPDDEILRVADRAQPVDAAIIEETARAAARILDEKYIDPAVGKAMADTILAHFGGGRYADAKKAGRFADALTESAVSVSKDKHTWIEAVNPLHVQSTYAENRPVEELRRENYHFRDIEILAGNVGYIKFDMIHDEQEAQDIAAIALATVKDCDALVFDLRDNIGGEFESGRLILSYILPESTVVSRMYDRDGRLISTNATLKKIPGERFDAAVPVYVLTSGRTGSAGEGFTYAVQQSGRGIVVGQTTLGMAHPSEEVRVNSRFLISVPVYRVESAFTENSFEGVGVVPDIDVPEQNALEAALQDAEKRLREAGRTAR